MVRVSPGKTALKLGEPPVITVARAAERVSEAAVRSPRELVAAALLAVEDPGLELDPCWLADPDRDTAARQQARFEELLAAYPDLERRWYGTSLRFEAARNEAISWLLELVGWGDGRRALEWARDEEEPAHNRWVMEGVFWREVRDRRLAARRARRRPGRNTHESPALVTGEPR